MSKEKRDHRERLEEKVPCRVFGSASEAVRSLAGEVADAIRARAGSGKPYVMGLATGSTPIAFYRELIRLHREEGLSFSEVVTFNLDEYGGLAADHPESYARFMHDQLFDHVDLKPENTNVPEGDLPADEIIEACAAYEQKIVDLGGIDLQILGIGRTGHIGFNEPGSPEDSRTRRITLDRITREDAAADFLGIENVPRFAVTMGVGTILDARRIVLMAWGENKADIVEEAVEGPVSDRVTASFLQHHGAAEFILDERAASSLTRFRRPWLVGAVDWGDTERLRAVPWLCQMVGKPVLRLVDEDYNAHGMADLLVEEGEAYELNIHIFNTVGHTISGWPGGKPEATEPHRPVSAKPFPKNVVVLAPEPEDELIGMGATLERLVAQDHDVRVVYQTSGGLRVPDRDVASYAQVLLESAEDGALSGGAAPAADFARSLLAALDKKGEFGEDDESLRNIKRYIRRVAAREGASRLGLEEDDLLFLDSPFYERGRYRRFRPGEEDVDRLSACLAEIKPDMIFAAGASSDPSSHRFLCFDLLRRVAAGDGSPIGEDTEVWLYRIDEPDFDIGEVNMAVPVSPDELTRKLDAIAQYRNHTSGSGLDGEAGRSLATAFDQLGLAEYEALEAFQRCSL